MCICCPLAVVMEKKTTSASERTFYLFFCLFSPRASSQFCRDSARSLAAAHNDGALPCNCDKSGSTGATCDPVGGQCPCKQHVIGRQCTKCATGYYGFPYCRREWKRRLPTLLRLVSSFVWMTSPLSRPLCSVWVRPPTVWRGDGTLHLPSSDGQTKLRGVSDSDVQLSPSAGLRGLRMLSKRHQNRRRARLWSRHRTVQVSAKLIDKAADLEVRITLYVVMLQLTMVFKFPLLITAHYGFPEPHVTSSCCFISPTSSPKLFIYCHDDKEKQQVFTFKKQKPANGLTTLSELSVSSCSLIFE